MNRLDIDNKFIDYVRMNEENCYNDYLKAIDKAAKSTAIYKGKPIPFLYMPKLFTEENFQSFQRIMNTMIEILKKVMDEYVNNKDYRKKFGFSKVLEELIVCEHGYSTYIPMGRFDIFYYNEEEFKFCELNADGSSAMNEDRELGRILKDTIALKNLNRYYDLKQCELFDSWIDECINIYINFSGEVEKPTVAIVDFFDRGTSSEFKVFKEKFEKRGYETLIVDPRNLTYKNGVLYKDLKKIDIVYRRMVTRDMMERIDEIPSFIESIKGGQVCIIGPIKTQIIHNKLIFKVLHEEDTLKFMNEEERNFIKNHIPYTFKLNKEMNLDKYIQNKDNYIVKPCDLYASKGVYAGKDHTKNEWITILNNCANKEYIIQEYYTPPITKLINFKNGKLFVEEFNNITGIYIYNENVKGVYSRVGREAIISGLHDYFTLPNFIASKK